MPYRFARRGRVRGGFLGGVAAVLVMAVPAAAVGPSGPTGFGSASHARFLARQRRGVDYDGRIVDGAGRPLDETVSLELRYFGSGPAAVFAERFDCVRIDGGRFRIHMGSGEALTGGKYRSLAEVFAALSDAHVEVSVDGAVYGPRLEILPAGHSLESRTVAAGVRKPADGRRHWEGYSSRGGATSVEAAVLAPLGSQPGPSAAGPSSSNSEVRRHPFTLPVIGPMLSRPVRDLAVVRTKAVGPPVEINPPRQESVMDSSGNRYGTTAPKQDDPLAGLRGPAVSSPSVGMTFDGIPNVYGYIPPDPEAAVGPSHYVEVVNTLFAIYDKAGHKLSGPTATNSLWTGFGGPCENDDSGDAIFLYDNLAKRFVLSQFAVAGNDQSVCFAVSQTSDPTGSYYLYEVVTPRFPDYYKVGVWPDSTNNAYFFATNSGTQGAFDVFAIDRAHMLAGTTARSVQYFQNFINFMMPADLDGPNAPPAGSPGLFYTFRDGGEPYFNSPPTDSLDLWEYHVDWTTPANSTITLADSFTPASGFASFNWTVCGAFVANCIPQPDTTRGLDSLSEWPMQRLVYRNFGDHEALVGSWTVNATSSGIRAAPRWFELRNSGSGWSIYQQGTQSPDAIDRWMSSIAMDKAGDLALGYSRGDGTHYPSLFYATRTPSDSLGTLETEAVLFAGTGSQTARGSRWGDYSSMELDPTDDCTFWYTNEYLATTSAASWRTRVGTFTVPGCLPTGGGPPSDLVLSNDTLAASTTYEACNSITLGPNLFFSAGAPGVVIRAPKIIFIPEVGTLSGAVAVFDNSKPAGCP